MKIILAQSTAAASPEGEYYRDALCAALENSRHHVELLNLPSIAVPGRALTQLASLRLLETDPAADAVVCLDAVAALIKHRRKLVLMLDDAYLGDERSALAHEPEAERSFITSILREGLSEAAHLFTLSRFASDRLRTLSLSPAETLQPAVPVPPNLYDRRQGPELLVLKALDERQRPELLIACLAKLPEPFRARWIASYASPLRLAQLQQLARRAGVDQRLAFEVRRISAGEQAYLLAGAAALVDLTPGSLIVSSAIRQAIARGVPVVTTHDAGAVSDIVGPGSPAPVEASAAELAQAVRGACSIEAATSSERVVEDEIATGWDPLLKLLAR